MKVTFVRAVLFVFEIAVLAIMICFVTAISEEALFNWTWIAIPTACFAWAALWGARKLGSHVAKTYEEKS